MIDKDEMNDFLISKFLEFSKLVPKGFIGDDLYQLGRYDAFEEVPEFLYQLGENDTK
ncbi:hypothetical protein [Psychrobacillus phage Perkons]|nr:hypothetical protein [Psychrobacillus phage Perkons]